MTIAEITKMQSKSNVKFEVAKKIRQLLDDAKKEYGAREWADDDVENAVIELVTGE